MAFIILSAFLAGCAADEAYRLGPIGGNNIWYSGSRYEVRTKNGITAYAAFKYKWYGTLTFYVVIENLGSDTLLVAPERFYTRDTYLMILRKRVGNEFQSGYAFENDTTLVSDTIYASNPEKHIYEFSNPGNNVGYSSRVNRQGDGRKYWLNTLLRKTTLLPKTAVAGKVYFRSLGRLHALNLIIPISSTELSFRFRRE